MKIAYLLTIGTPIGGAQIHVRDLSQWLSVNGHECHVLCGNPGAFEKQFEKQKVEFHAINSLERSILPLKDIKALTDVVRSLKKINPDILSIHSSKAGIVGRAAAHLVGIPCIFTAHGWAFAHGVSSSTRILYGSIEKIAAMFAEKIITVSEHDRSLALRLKVAHKNRLITIHNGMPDIPPALLSAPAQEPVKIVMVARFQKQKDFVTLFSALSGLLGYKWSLNLIGDGPLLDLVQSQAEGFRITDRIIFWGEQDNVAEHLSKCQIFVLTSNWEGLPRSILEAMRAGLPVIVSDVGGVSEAVVDEKTGFLIPRKDNKTLQNRLKILIADPEKRKKMGKAGRESYEKNFTFNKMAEKTLQVYEEVLDSKSIDIKAINFELN
ncbi:MAG: glycosyltransferase family 4 protein [Deltaproteobacteria bacterium]|nr:glycosyltransferase family 4 protein [Deltaproteobacteria bacterium]